MRNKKGAMLDEASFEVIIAVAVVVLIVILIAKLFSPVYNEGDKIAESYFEQLKKSIVEADGGNPSSFFILDNEDDEVNFYLVYFGGVLSFSYTDGVFNDMLGTGDISLAPPSDGKNVVFVRSKNGDNVICVCEEQVSKVVCNYCVDLKLPAVSNVEGAHNVWVIGEDNLIKIRKSGGNYGFLVK